jgi:hypothetical protein
VLLIAIDPGVVTGLAYWYPDSGQPPEAFEDPEDEAVDRVEGWLDTRCDEWLKANTLVVCEDFKPRGGALTWFPEALHQIGHFRHECRQRGIAYRLQQPGNMKKFVEGGKLKRYRDGEWYRIAMAAYQPHNTSHPQALDAVGHLLLASIKIGLIDGAELL